MFSKYFFLSAFFVPVLSQSLCYYVNVVRRRNKKTRFKETEIMKTTFKKITAISLATLTLAFASCFTSFAAEDKGEADNGKENDGYVCADIPAEYGNGIWDYEDSSYTFYDEWEAYGDCFFTGVDFLA